MTLIGPMARDVEDAAALLDVLLGGDPASPNAFLARARVRPPRMGVGSLWRSPLGDVDPELLAAAEEAAAALAERGPRVARLEGASADVEEFLPVYQSHLAAVPVPFEGKLQPLTRWSRAEDRRRTREEVERAFDALSARAIAAFGDVDVALTQTTAALAPPRSAPGRRSTPRPRSARRRRWARSPRPATSPARPGSRSRGVSRAAASSGRPDHRASGRGRASPLAGRELEALRRDPPGEAPAGD